MRAKPGTLYKIQLLAMLRAKYGEENVETEFRFHPARRWRFDYAVPSIQLAVEYNGHGQTGHKNHVGGHGSIVGISHDAEKLNAAQLLGWKIIQFTALHFDPRARLKHRLSAPAEII